MKGNKKKSYPNGPFEIIKTFLSIFLPVMVLVGGLVMVLFYKDQNFKKSILASEEVQYLEHHSEEILHDFNMVVSDLVFLAGLNEFQEIFDGNVSGPIKKLAKEYLSFSRARGIYDQIRFLDGAGMEVVRINYNDGKPNIVSKEQLQSKAHRYYFKDTFKLKPGEVYASPFDLNMENAEIEQPLKPMVRVGTPVFDSLGRKKGIVVLNYLGKKLIDNFGKRAAEAPAMLMLLNSDGYWMKGVRAEDEWGFMYQERKDRTFGNAFPEAWQRISETESGQFYIKGALFTFLTIYPLLPEGRPGTPSGKTSDSGTTLLNAGKYHWKMVSYAPHDALNAETRKSLPRFFQLTIAFGFILAVGSGVLARTRVARNLKDKALKALNTELVNKNRELEQIVYVTSHDLRTPLVNIHGFSKEIGETIKEINLILKSEDISPSGKIKLTPLLEEGLTKSLDYVLTSASKMDKLLSGLLRVSRLGGVTINITRLDMNKLITSIEKTFGYKIKQTGASLVIDELPPGTGDMEQINQVFSNLLENALKYLSPKRPGIIKISGRREEGVVIYCIEDNGIGISADNQKNIFTIFRRVDTRTTTGEGLGLAIIKKIMTRHGEVWVESELGKGSKFFVSLSA